MALLACPFCREMFELGEKPVCPVCGVRLVAFEKLPVSEDALNEDGVIREPEWEPLPFAFMGRSRGALAVLGVAGLVAFFLPWVHVTVPDEAWFSGPDFAHRMGWPWAAGVAWFVLLPIVLSRRSIMKMRGARVAVSFLAAIPGITSIELLARTQHGSHGTTVAYGWTYGIYTTLALSVAAVAFGLFFGGRVDDISVRRGTSAGQVVH